MGKWVKSKGLSVDDQITRLQSELKTKLSVFRLVLLLQIIQIIAGLAFTYYLLRVM